MPAANSLTDIMSAIQRQAPNSPLVKGTQGARTANAIYQASKKYNVDWRLIVAIMGAESSYGQDPTAQKLHNPFGMGPNIRYPSWEASIDAAAKNLRQNYLDKGLTTVPQIGAKWAPVGTANDPNNLNSNWVQNVSAIYKKLGGKDSEIPTSQTGSNLSPGSFIPDNPVSALVDVFKLLLDPSLWIRIGEMILGVIAMVGGGVVLFKMSGVAGKPIGLLIIGFGFMWLYSGIKNVSPVDSLKAFVGA